MSHQGSVSSMTNGEQLAQVIQELIPKEILEDIHFQASARWTPITLVTAALYWSWSGEKGLKDRFTQARRILCLGSDSQHGVSYQGFLKRLAVWHLALLERIKKELRRQMLGEAHQWGRVAGWLVLAADGSRCQAARTRSNQKRFAAPKKTKTKTKTTKSKTKKTKKTKKKAQAKPRQQKAKKKQPPKRLKQSAADRAKKAETPQVWLTVLSVVALGLPWDWRTGPSGSSERDHLRAMIDTLPEHALVTLDAGFVGFSFWKALNDAGVRLVCRVGRNVKLLKQLGRVRIADNRVFAWPDDARRRGDPPLMFRLESFHDGREPVYLLTNVLEPEQLSTADLRAVYRARWGVELFYRDLKQTFERAKLRSKSADPALLELDWSLVGLWAANWYALREQTRAGIGPQERSVAQVLRALRRAMHEYKSTADPGEDVWSLLRQARKDSYHRTRSKASVNYPHQKPKRQIGPPFILSATEEQREAAKKHFAVTHQAHGLTA